MQYRNLDTFAKLLTESSINDPPEASRNAARASSLANESEVNVRQVINIWTTK